MGNGGCKTTKDKLLGVVEPGGGKGRGSSESSRREEIYNDLCRSRKGLH